MLLNIIRKKSKRFEGKKVSKLKKKVTVTC